MTINLTIRQMLTILVLMGVLGVLALSITSLNSNSQLLNNHKQLIDVVLPLEEANREIKTILMTFIIRLEQITNVNTLKELQPLVPRHSLEQGFEKKREQLEKLAVKMTKLKQKITQLTTSYTAFLKTDTAILTSIQHRLKLEHNITKQRQRLNEVDTRLQINAEALAGTMNFVMMQQIFRLRKLLHANQIKESSEVIMRLFQQDMALKQKACNDLQIIASSLNTYGHYLLLTKTPAQINNIKANQLAQAFELVQVSLNILIQELDHSSELARIIQAIEKDIFVLKSILLKGDDSLATLQNQWLVQQKHQTKLLSVSKHNIEAITANLDQLQLLWENMHKIATQKAMQTGTASEMIIIIVGTIAILFMIMVGTLIAYRILIPIKKVAMFAANVSRGDLTASIQLQQKDELGNIVLELTKMANNLALLVGQIQQSGIQLTSSATELAATAKQQKATLLNQVESTNQVEQSVENISKLAVELVQTMQQVAAMSEETAQFASRGQTDLSRMEEAMFSMENASKAIAGKLENINEKTEKITYMVATITKVADQTNLLSLNAAIEAEKAGEYGRGFNVVAREIRRLADQTAVATMDIENMVKEMQSAVAAGVMEMDKFIMEVRHSAKDVNNINLQMNQIIAQVQTLSPRFEEVNLAVAHQSNNAQNINRAMTEVSEGMQQTAESLEESFFSVEQLNDAARKLQQEISRFRIERENNVN